MSGPWTFDQSNENARLGSAQQRTAEDFVKQATKQAAIAEGAYRERLAARIVELRAEGHAATLVKDLARGDKEIVKLKIEAMVADGVREAAVQAVWRASADRRHIEGMTEWSMRRELAEGRGRDPEPPAVETFGRRAA